MGLMEEHVQIDLQQENERVTIIAPRGRIDMASAPAFREQVKQLVESGSKHVVVDLGDVSFIDSSGLGAIIGCLKMARQADGELRIACANQQVLLVLDLTSLNRVLPPYESVEEAIAGL
jgi:anti-sigma B factor antagonist